MNQQPDKIFRDKLQSFQTPAPSGAWNRIEANLDKKKNKVLWLRIAATLLLLAVATYLLLPPNSVTTSPNEIAKSNHQKKSLNTPPVVKNESKVDSLIVNKSVAKNDARPSSIGSKKNANRTQRIDNAKQHSITSESNIPKETPVASIVEEKQLGPDVTEQLESVIENSTAEQPVIVAAAENKKVKIIFSAEEVDNKYLDKNAVAQATSEDKKPSTLKKIFDKAYDLKYNQDPFGDLRDKKNEILALNFRTDKQRSDKK
jgi:hypothetical protein